MRHEYTDAELLRIPAITITPGIMGADGVLRGAHYRNPFTLAAMAESRGNQDEAGAGEAARRWGELHWGDGGAETHELDPLAVFAAELGMQDAGFHRHENPESGATTFFPNVPVLKGDAQREAEDAWEAAAEAMHENQQPVLIERKPQSTASDRAGLRRGD